MRAHMEENTKDAMATTSTKVYGQIHRKPCAQFNPAFVQNARKVGFTKKFRSKEEKFYQSFLHKNNYEKKIR
jgi:hypothetical protein